MVKARLALADEKRGLAVRYGKQAEGLMPDDADVHLLQADIEEDRERSPEEPLRKAANAPVPMRARGYDAEASYSPDGERIVFASNRHAYEGDPPERLETDPSYFVDLYLMNADGSEVRRLTDTPGYDGGPFFSPDGKRVVWRRFSEDGATAEIHTMALDGSDTRQADPARGHELGAVLPPVGALRRVHDQPARVRELRAVHRRCPGRTRAGARDAERRLRRSAGVHAGRAPALVDQRTRRRGPLADLAVGLGSRRGAGRAGAPRCRAFRRGPTAASGRSADRRSRARTPRRGADLRRHGGTRDRDRG